MNLLADHLRDQQAIPEKALIHLIGFNVPQAFLWERGELVSINNTVPQLSKAIEQVKKRQGYTLFWDFIQGIPDVSILEEAILGRGDIWHGNFSPESGQSSRLLPFAWPCWMLNISPKEPFSFISWKFDFGCTLLENKVFEKIGTIYPLFHSPEGAALEFGLRCIKQGGVPVFLPQLYKVREKLARKRNVLKLPTFDEILLMRLHFSSVWVWWAAVRAISQGIVPLIPTLQALFSSRNTPLLPKNLDRSSASPSVSRTYSVSIVMITLGRYAYITTVIDQLLAQNIPPIEIIIVDATPKNARIQDVLSAYQNSSVPVRIIYSETIGQCTQRNIAIKEAKGEYILFVDDDMDEIPEDHLQKHLSNLLVFQADVSCGMPDEVNALPVNRNLPPCVSDVFPTNDCLVKRSVLERSGLFDERMDRGQSEDHELGTRIFLSGALMIKDAVIRCLHLRASSGGLRTHGNRVITYSSSRKRIFHRRLPHVTEIYLRLKFFSSKEVHESQLLSILGSFSISGNIFNKTAKLIVSTIMLPLTIITLKQRTNKAEELIRKGPIVPSLYHDEKT